MLIIKLVPVIWLILKWVWTASGLHRVRVPSCICGTSMTALPLVSLTAIPSSTHCKCSDNMAVISVKSMFLFFVYKCSFQSAFALAQVLGKIGSVRGSWYWFKQLTRYTIDQGVYLASRFIDTTRNFITCDWWGLLQCNPHSQTKMQFPSSKN